MLEGLLPLEWMLAVLRDENAEPARRDTMAIQAASFCHPRLGAVLQASIPGRDIVEDAAAAVNIVAIPRGGKIDPTTGVVTAEEIVPIKPFRGTPSLEVTDQREPAPIEPIEPLPVIEIDTSNVMPLRRREDDGAA